MRLRPTLCLLLLLAPACVEAPPPAAPAVPEPVVLTADGAWCWFQDPRAVTLAGTRTRTYAQWMTADARLVVGAFDHDTGAIETHTLKTDWAVDDHNVGAFVILPDRRLMAFYARHNEQGLYARTTTRSEDITAWDDEVTVSDTDRITYAHPAYLSEEGRFYVFWRGPTWKPTFATSEDGRTWSAPQVLIQDEGRAAGDIRPYTKITSDGRSTLHIAFTDGHPRNEAHNGVYYLRYQQGRFSTAAGEEVGTMASLPIPHRRSDRVYDGAGPGGRAWVWDIAADAAGRPVVAYTRLPAEDDHRYHVARWDGTRWHDTEVTSGGGWFPQTPAGQTEPEPHYSGGLTLDPANPDRVFTARPIDGVFEIEQWDRGPDGQRWNPRALTAGSAQHNVRPVVPRGGASGVVLWMHGAYTHYTNYATGIRLVQLSP